MTKHFLLGVLTPSQPSFSEITILEGQDELVGTSDRPIIEVLLSSRSSDSLEDLSSESLSCNGADDIDCVLLFADVADPLQEDVLELRNVDIAGFTTLEGSEGLLEVGLGSVAICSRLVEVLSQRLDLCGLLSRSFVTGVLQGSSFVRPLLVGGAELALDGAVVLAGPGAEGSEQPILLPVDQDLLHRALFLVLLACVLQPRIEASTVLHLSHAAHVVGHDFLGEALGLGLDGDAPRLHGLDLFPLVLNGQVLALDRGTHALCLLHEGHLHLSSLDVLPLLEGGACQVPGNAIHRSLHELSRQLKFADVLLPGGHAVLQ